MEIEKCVIQITSEREFDDVSKICLANDLKWCDSDDTYNSVDSEKRIIIVCDDGTSILYDTGTGSGYTVKTRVSYSEFMDKYGKIEVDNIEIEKNKVAISSEKEFNDVSKICLDNGFTWSDSDDAYNKIHGNNKGILIMNGDKDTLYVKDKECYEYDEISYSTFMSKYGKNNTSEVKKMKIDRCEVMITSEEDFDKVSRICLANGGKWIDGDDTYGSMVCTYKTIDIDSDGDMTYDSRVDYDDDDLISCDEFMRKYGNKQEIKVNKMKIENCRIKITSKEEFRKVEDVCFKNDIGWSAAGKSHHDFYNGRDLLISISDSYSVGKSLSFNSVVAGTYMSFNCFMQRYGNSNSSTPKYRIKTEKEFINEYGKAWRGSLKFYFNHNMSHLHSKMITTEQMQEVIRDGGIKIDGYNISKDMIIECNKSDTSTLMKKIKTVLHINQREPVKLNDSLYKTNKIQLNQDNKTNY